MPFTGFNLKYPEYEVITPQTNQSFKMRSLSVKEEEKLKGSFVTPAKITEHLNRCIYETITQKPAEITDYKTFLQNVTLKDREALLYGLYHITYEEIRNYDVRCATCRREFPVTVKASSTFNFTPYEGEDKIIGQHMKVDLPVSKGVAAFIKQPTLWDEQQAIEELGNIPGVNLEIITETLVIDRFVQEAQEKIPERVYSDRQSVVDAYLSLPARDKRVIHQDYIKQFGNFAVALKMKVFCQHCGADDIIDIDMVENFFRMVYSA